MTKRTAIAAVALILGLTAAARAQQADTVIATVGGTDITLGHMIAMRERLPQDYQSLDDRTLFDGILDQLVQQEALGAEADDLNRRNTLILDNERRSLAAAQRLEGLASALVTDAAIQEAYDARYGGGPSLEYDASHILVDTEERAQELVGELEDGADFAQLARQNSTGPSGPSGGELGWFQPGAMVPAFDQTVQGMEPGEIAGPVETEFGWHVIRLNDTRERDAPPLDEVRGELEQELRQQAIQTAIDAAMADVDITRPDGQIDPAMIRQDELIAP